MIVAFTGHRPDKVGGYNLPNPTYIHICREIEKALKELNPDKAISGMALGVDSYAASVCIRLNIPFIAAIPFKGQEKAWPQKSQRAYHLLLSKSCEQVIVCEGEYAPFKMQVRNQWMVDHCDVLIAIWDGTPGGTANCINYAKAKNKQIIFINPAP
jgi:uncharacterized phage-like protein YoqJ